MSSNVMFDSKRWKCREHHEASEFRMHCRNWFHVSSLLSFMSFSCTYIIWRGKENELESDTGKLWFWSVLWTCEWYFLKIGEKISQDGISMHLFFSGTTCSLFWKCEVFVLWRPILYCCVCKLNLERISKFVSHDWMWSCTPNCWVRLRKTQWADHLIAKSLSSCFICFRLWVLASFACRKRELKTKH